MIFKKVLFLLFLTSTITSKQIHGVFTNFDSLSSTSASNQVPNLPTWFAVLSWSLDGEKCFPGDTFSLQMLGVHRFVTTKSSFNLGVDDTVFASCEMISANENYSYSSLECMVTSNLKRNTKASGTVKLPLVFTVGGSVTPNTINAATYYTVGENLVTFNDGINKLQIQTIFASSNINSENPISFTRFDSTRKQIFNSVIGPYCAKGYSAGRLGISVNSNNAQFNCSTASVSITNKLNSWNLPMSIDTFKYDILCTPSSLTISYNNIPVGFRPYISASLVTTGEENISLKYLVQNICFSESYRDKSFTTTLSQHQDTYDVEVKGTYNIYTTRTGYDSTTRVTTLPYQSTDRTITIEVLQPIPTTTITTSYVGVTTSYSTITASIGGTATVIVDNPYHTSTTVTTYWTGGITTTTTRIDPSNSVDTVIVEVPRPNPTTTLTTFWTGLTPTTFTQTNPPLGTDTVIVQEPHKPTTTLTTFWTGLTPTTLIQTNTPLGSDTVIVLEPPNPTVTTTIFSSVIAPSTQTFTEGPLGTDSVIVVEPPNPTYTTTELWYESFALTTTQVNDPQGTDTVIIYEPYVSSETFISEYGSLITDTYIGSSSVEYSELVKSDSSDSDSLLLSLAAGSIGESSPEATVSVSASIEDSSSLDTFDDSPRMDIPTSTVDSTSSDEYASVVSSVVSNEKPSNLQLSSDEWSSSSETGYASEISDDWSTIRTDEIDDDSSDFTTIESATWVDETSDPTLSTLPLESSSAVTEESIYSSDLSSDVHDASSESVGDYSTAADVSSSDLWLSSATSDAEESSEYSSTEVSTSSEYNEVSDFVSNSVTTPAWSSDIIEMSSASDEDSSSIIDETSSSLVLSSSSTIRYWNSSILAWGSASSADPVEYVSTTEDSSFIGSPLSSSETTDPPSISVIDSWFSESSDFSSIEESASETGEISITIVSSTDSSGDTSTSTDVETGGFETSYLPSSSSIGFLSETDIHSISLQIETIEHIETSYQSQETLDTTMAVSMILFSSDFLSSSQSDELSRTIKSTENWSEAEFTDTFESVGGTRVPRGGGAPWRTESFTITSREQSLESDDYLSQSATISEYTEETSLDFDNVNENELMPSSKESESTHTTESISETTLESLIDVSDLVVSTFSTDSDYVFVPSESVMSESSSSAEASSAIDSDEIASSTETFKFFTESETDDEYSAILAVEESGVIASDPVLTSLTLHNATIESSDTSPAVSVQVIEEITSVYSWNLTTTTSVDINSEPISASSLPSMIEDCETSDLSDEQFVSSLATFAESINIHPSIDAVHSSTNFTLSVESIPSSEIALSSNVYNNSTAEEVETITSASTSTDTERYRPIYTLSEQEQEITTSSYPLSIAGPPTINPSPSSNMNETSPHNTDISHIASSSDTFDDGLTRTWLEQSQLTDLESDVLMTESTDGLSVSKSVLISESTVVSSEQGIYITPTGSHDVSNTDDDEHSTTISETQYSHEETYIESSVFTDDSTTVSQSTISADYSSSENIPMVSNAPNLSENSDNWLTRFPNITTTNELASSVSGFEPVPSTTQLFPLQPNSDVEMSSRAYQSYSNKTVSAVNFNSAESDTTFANPLLSTGVVDAISSDVISSASPSSEDNGNVIAMTMSESSNSFDTLSSIHEPDVSNILEPFVNTSTTVNFPKHESNIGDEYTVINDVIQINSKTLSSEIITQTGKSDNTATVIPDLQGTTLTYEVYNNLNTSISPISTIYVGSGFSIKQSLSMMSLIFSVLIFL